MLSDTSNIAVTQDMVDQGFYVSAYWEPGDWKADYAWYFDTGMTFPANDFGAGDSATPLMSAGAMPPVQITGYDLVVFLILLIPIFILFNSNDSAQRYYYGYGDSDGLGDNGGARTDSVDSLSFAGRWWV